MRNLKRVLSLALASVMLVGMMVVGTSAAGYADVDAEDNVEAIEVLQAVGIMVGDNGSFNPDQNVTRNEMAVVMSNLMNYRVATYAGTSPFTDVPSWAEPYVAACYTNGITSGTSPSTYGGSGNVTGAQAALMLLKALGYFQYSQDFGDDWMLSTVRQANFIDLFEDVEAGVREPMTRNDVAQIVLNTLKSGTVEAEAGDRFSATTGDVQVSVTGTTKYTYVTSTRDYAKAIFDNTANNGSWATSANNLQAPIVELGEKLYQGDLVLYDDVRDSFGRPATTWRYKTQDVGTYPDTPIAVYTAKVSQGELQALVGKGNSDKLTRNGDSIGNKLSVYANGYDAWNDGVSAATYFNNNLSAAAGANGHDGKAGRGVVTEVYTDNFNNVTVVFINTYLVQATEDYSADKGSVNITAITNPMNTGILDTVLYDDDFDLTGIKAEDYLLVTASTPVSGPNSGVKYDIETIAPAKVVTGEVTEFSQENYVYIDGTKYDYAERIENVNTNSSKKTEFTVGTNAAIVLDAYDNVLYVDDASLSVGNYLYLRGIVSDNGFSDNFTAQVYLTDGTKQNISIDTLKDASGAKVDLANASPAIDGKDDGTNDDKLGGWYSYTIGSDGKYTLRQSATGFQTGGGAPGFDDTTYTYAGQMINGNNTRAVIENGKVNFLVGNSNVWGNEKTIFIIDDGDTVNVYTGVSNVPDITVKNEGGNDEIAVVGYLREKDTANSVVAAVFVYAEDCIISNSSSSLMFVLNKDKNVVDKTTQEVAEYWNAIVDGTLTQIKVKQGYFAGAELINSHNCVYKLYDKVTVDKDGFYKGTLFAVGNSDSYRQGSGLNEINFSGEVLSMNYIDANPALCVYNNYIITRDTQIVLVMDNSDHASSCAAQGVNNNVAKIMADGSKKYEVRNFGSNASAVATLLKPWNHDTATGRDMGYAFYGVALDKDSSVLKTLYIYITNLT